MFTTLFTIAMSLSLAGNAYDIYMTRKGLKAGVAVEGNTWLIGPKPSTKALVLRDSIIQGIVAALPLVLHAVNPPAGVGALVIPVVFAIRHYLGGRAWMKLGV